MSTPKQNINSKKIMLIGLGYLGSTVLELLSRDPNIGEIVTAGRNEMKCLARCNLARLGAMAQGFTPHIRFRTLDLNRVEDTAEFVRSEEPDIILTCATMQSWWVPHSLPGSKAESLKETGFGMWLPIHLNLSIKLMQALKSISYGGIVLTAPFPDVVNCVLDRIGLPPTCGVGNLAEIVPKVEWLASRRLKCEPDNVKVAMVGHHALEKYVFTRVEKAHRLPYFLRVEFQDQDVTEAIHADQLLFAPFSITTGLETHFATAGSTIRLIKAFQDEEWHMLHVPGPNGLPGGYPAMVSREGLKIADVPNLTLEDAISINERSHPFDGIEEIHKDGTVVFTPEATKAFKSVLNYDCSVLSPEEVEPRAQELLVRIRELAAKSRDVQ